MVLQMRPFEALERELLEGILQWLDAPADLYNLCLVSRSFKIIAEPFLYSSFVWNWTRHRADGYPTEWALQVVPIISFLRTLLERPDLADHVREVKLLGDGFVYSRSRFDDWVHHLQPVVSVQGLDLTRAETYIETLRFPFTELWRARLRSGTVDALAALLLVQVPRLQRLTLGPNFTHDNQLLGHLLRLALLDRSPKILQPFANLRQVTYKLLDGKFELQLYGTHTANALMLFYLPEVRRLSVALDFPTTLIWPLDPPILPTLRNLELTLVREASLLPLLKATPKLEMLRWQYYSSDESAHPFNPSTIDLDVLGISLNQIKSTLTALTIRNDAHISHAESPSAPLKFQGSLTALFNLERLKTLDITLDILAASSSPEHRVRLKSVVPQCLQDLIISHEHHYLGFIHKDRWDPASVHAFLAEWLTEIDLTCFDLRRVTLELVVLGQLHTRFGDWWSTAACRELRALCSSHGLEVEIMSRTKDPQLYRWAKDI